ncbi:hypothetical protein BDC45DRAFT_539096 [Circinella umbellata]|nr:hypothetical protein BDC45DRAFT_539096 [Circinella umbellata]
MLAFHQWKGIFKAFQEYNVLPESSTIYQGPKNNAFLHMLEVTCSSQQNLTELILMDYPSGFDTQIEPLLRHCPELRVFQASKLNDVLEEITLKNIMFMDNRLLVLNNFNFTRMIQLCPKITSIDCNFNGLCEWSSIPDNEKRGDHTKYGLKTFRIAYDQGNSYVQSIIDSVGTSTRYSRGFKYSRTTPWMMLRNQDYTAPGLLQLILAKHDGEIRPKIKPRDKVTTIT